MKTEEYVDPLVVANRRSCCVVEPGTTVKLLGLNQLKHSDPIFVQVLERLPSSSHSVYDADCKYVGIALSTPPNIKGLRQRSRVEFQARHIMCITPLYVLMDAEETARSFTTFEIPSLTECRTLEVNRHVKLGFFQEDFEHVFECERMWVSVSEINHIKTKVGDNVVEDIQYKGWLTNHPAGLHGTDRFDFFVFNPENVLMIHKVVVLPGLAEPDMVKQVNRINHPYYYKSDI